MKTLAQRFWSKVQKTDECWLWTGALDRAGYGRFHLAGVNVVAYRVAYELLVGPVPAGLTVDHLCRVRRCVRPDHLEPVTQRENILRGVGVGAVNAKRTHCSAGHPLAGDNLVPSMLKRGRRYCRICWNARCRARRAA